MTGEFSPCPACPSANVYGIRGLTRITDCIRSYGLLDDEELEEYVDRFETLLGRKLALGRGSAVPLRLTLDKVNMLHRSLLWYLVSRRHWQGLLMSRVLMVEQSASVLLIQSRSFTCCTIPSSFMGLDSSNCSPCSHSGLWPSLVFTKAPEEACRTGIGLIHLLLPSQYFSYMALALVSIPM